MKVIQINLKKKLMHQNNLKKKKVRNVFKFKLMGSYTYKIMVITTFLLFKN